MYQQRRQGCAKHCILVCLLSLFALLGCGLETFYYIDYIPQGSYLDETRSSVRLPSSGSEGYGDNQYFTHFIIFYRIYLSENNPTGTLNRDGETLSLINPSLLTDYNWSIRYTDITSTTVNTSNLETTFLSQRYYKLELEGARIESVLGRGALGRTLGISFYDGGGRDPELILGYDLDPTLQQHYTLQRVNPSSVPGYTFILQPVDSSSFFNFSELRDPSNATAEKNADVALNSRGGEIRYTYVSMYIAAVGTTFETPPKTIYSQPTFLGIFRLPER
jgi:hypothetical protein